MNSNERKRKALRNNQQNLFKGRGIASTWNAVDLGLPPPVCLLIFVSTSRSLPPKICSKGGALHLLLEKGAP